MLDQIIDKLNSIFNESADTGIKSKSLNAQLAKEVLSRYSLSDLLPYYYFDEQHDIFVNKHSFGFVIETIPLLGFSDEVEREISGLFKDTFPEGANIQFLLIASPKIGNELNIWQEKRNQQSPVIRALAQKRTEFLSKFAYTPAKIRNYRLIISYSQHSKTGINELEKKETKDLREQLVTTFKSLNLPVKIWDGEDLINTLTDILDLNDDIVPSKTVWNKHQDLSSQILTNNTCIGLDPSGLNYNGGEFTLRTYSVKRYPDSWYQGAMTNLIGDNFRDLLQITCPFMFSFAINIIDNKSLKTKLLTKGARVESQANSVLAKWMPSLTREAQEWRYVRSEFEGGERLVRSHYQIALFSSAEKIANDEQSLFTLYRSNQWELMRDKYIQLPSLISMLPMSWGEGMEYDMVTYNKARISLSSEPVNLLPIQGEWMGTQSPGMILQGRRGQIFYWNPFDNNAGNYNVCVVGCSGSGKSVFMQELVTSTLGLGGKVFVLDVGRSFEKTSKLLGGDFVEFSTKSTICINPFSTIVGDDKETISDSLAMLKPILALMISPEEGVSKKEYSLIEQAITCAWSKKGNKAGIGDVANWLSNHKDKEACDLGTILYPYTPEGNYGRFFNGDASITFDNNLNVIELEEVKGRKDLQAVVVQILILQISNRMFLGNRVTPYNIVFDEAWDMLKDAKSSEFIETLARRLRKYNGSLVIGTQSIDDLYRNPSAKAAFDNSDWVCMLSQKKESIEQLKQSGKFAIDDHMEKMLNSVTTKQGEYSEIMISSSTGYAIGRLTLDPFSKVLYSTKADEYAAVKSLEAQGNTLEEAVAIVAEQKYGL